MSQKGQPSRMGRGQGGGSVKRAREMLNSGARAEQEGSRDMPPPLRPRATHSRTSSNDAEIEIGFEYEDDPRGPVPIMPIQGLQVPKHNGPPPSSRRGPSSVYSRMITGTAVSPIPEENFRQAGKKESYASSAVIPTSWGSASPMSDISDAYPNEPDSPKRNSVRQKRESVAVLRQASLGKRGKPSLRSINRTQAPPPQPTTQDDKSSDSRLGYSTVNGLQPRTSLESVSTDTDSIDLEKERIEIENENKARNIGMGFGLGRPGAGMSSRKPNSHRPPQLDLNAVRSAEAHGSLTSLPDLIRRATKVASNLEHGRTASRLGLLDMFDFSNQTKKVRASLHRSSASLSDILASFPPPRTGTPDDSVRTSWPEMQHNPVEKSRLREMQLNASEDPNANGRRRRRCCGMSRTVFFFVLLVIICIIAAAVTIPIVLVVLPRRNHEAVAAVPAVTTTAPAMTCQQKFPCLNGGVSVMSGGSCSCVCINGFSGSQCGTASDGSCTTMKSQQSGNTTIGNALPNLFVQSQTDFNITLNETEILTLFNAQNLSCTVQNALVEFGGVSSPTSRRRRGSPIEIREPKERPLITATPVVRRASGPLILDATYVPPILSVPSSTASGANSPPVTEVAGAMQTAAVPTTTTAPAASTTTASPSSAPSASSAISRVFEFARVAVLFIFEQTQDFSAASTAQHDIDLYLLSQDLGNTTNMKMSLTHPQTFVLNFTSFTITLSNGTVIGGGNGSAT